MSKIALNQPCVCPLISQSEPASALGARKRLCSGNSSCSTSSHKQIERRDGVGPPRPGACLDEVGAGECDAGVVQLLHYGFSLAGWMMDVKAQKITIDDSYLIK